MTTGTSVDKATETDVDAQTADDVSAPDTTVAEADSTKKRSASRSSSMGERSVSMKTLLRWGAAIVLVVAMVVTIGVLAWQLSSKSSDLDDVNDTLAGQKRAEQVSLDYATGAAQMDFNDLEAWKARLTEGTTPELTNRLGQAATSMQQLIQPMQWTSTATPIASKVESAADGVYQVVTFVNVTTKNTQTPEGIESTATYKMTIDSNNDWVITEISGLDSAIDPANAPR